MSVFEQVVNATDEALRMAAEVPFERGIAREVLSQLTESGSASATPRAVVLDGPRRVGKSVALAQVLRHLRDAGAEAWYCDFTHPLLARDGLSKVADAMLGGRGARGRVFLLFDEVHEARDWAPELKLLVDNRAARIAVADSYAATVRSGLRERGVGRVSFVSAHPLGLAEWRDLHTAAGLTTARDPYERLEECDRYLRVGGLPEAAFERGSLDRIGRRIRHDVVAQAARVDAAHVHGVREDTDLAALLVTLIQRSGAMITEQETAKLLDRSRPTAKHWLKALEDTGLVWPLHRFGAAGGRAPPKIYCCDPGLVAMCSIRPDETLPSRVETAVAQALRVFAERRGGQLGFWRGRKSQEADFVYRDARSLVIVEATSGDGELKPKALAKRANEIGTRGAKRVWLGVAARRAVRAERDDDGAHVHIVPLHELLEALDRNDAEALGW